MRDALFKFYTTKFLIHKTNFLNRKSKCNLIYERTQQDHRLYQNLNVVIHEQPR